MYSSQLRSQRILIFLSKLVSTLQEMSPVSDRSMSVWNLKPYSWKHSTDQTDPTCFRECVVKVKAVFALFSLFRGFTVPGRFEVTEAVCLQTAGWWLPYVWKQTVSYSAQWEHIWCPAVVQTAASGVWWWLHVTSDMTSAVVQCPTGDCWAVSTGWMWWNKPTMKAHGSQCENCTAEHFSHHHVVLCV